MPMFFGRIERNFYLDGFGVGNIILKYKIIGRYSSTYEDFDGDIDNLVFYKFGFICDFGRN